MNNIKAVIFDLDGTLIDSMGIWAQIDKEYLGNFGYAVPENLQEEITHLTLTETAIYFKNKFNINDIGILAAYGGKDVGSQLKKLNKGINLIIAILEDYLIT